MMLLTVPAALKVSVTGNEAGAVPTLELGMTIVAPLPLLPAKVLLTPA